ncbi:MAG: DNA polymerase I [Alphaproteobacteria bacterium]|nr:DNA polymerase I [Alphaproteobacteria bacterium]
MIANTPSTVVCPVNAGDHVFLVDGSSYIFRAYHALPPLTRKSDNLPVGAVSGFCNMLWKLLQDLKSRESPTHLAVIFDAPGDTFRNSIYPAYKANRKERPEDLVIQFPLFREASRAFSIPCLEQEGFEADDLLATYAKQASSREAFVSIIGSDKDLMQLVDERVELFDSMKNKVIGIEEVLKKFGVSPNKVADVQALMGDAIDNVPGVPGIGIKTAARFINEFGSLEVLLSRLEELKDSRHHENLIHFSEQALLSFRLVQLDRNVPVTLPLDSFGLVQFDPVRLIAFLKAMEFTSLTARVSEMMGISVASIEPDSRLMAVPVPSGIWRGLPSERSRKGTPQALSGSRACEEVKIVHSAYECVTTPGELRLWTADAFERGVVAIDTETTSLDSMDCILVGISLATAPGKACYIPLNHRVDENLSEDDKSHPVQQIDMKEALAILKPVLESPCVIKVGQNLKYDWVVLARYGIRIRPVDDTMLISYVLDAGKHGHGLDELSRLHLNHQSILFKDVVGTGKSQISFDFVPVDKATAYAAEDADLTLRLYRRLKPRLISERLSTVYELLERPMIETLAKMEYAGIGIETNVLVNLSKEFGKSLERLASELELLAGFAFNPASSRQVGDILFEKMEFPGGKKTRTGLWATGADILEGLASKNYEFPSKILEWRKLSKLRSTYTQALLTHINARTHRVHTSYSLAATTTGRLSSSHPNLQNIPAHTEDGRRIRAAFVAPPGHKLISADYNQVELRILAHITEVPNLQQAFLDGVDIHTMTAREIFGASSDPAEFRARHRAKAINFGIIYGISPFGLSKQLKISQKEALNYMNIYFERFPGIRTYVEEMKAFCHEHGFVQTIFGRKIHYPDINSRDRHHRSFIERAAVNAPIQGSAADIICRAMVRMQAALKERNLPVRMLLQVHDELLFEVPDDYVGSAVETIKSVMEEASGPALKLKIPLIVDTRIAENWSAVR